MDSMPKEIVQTPIAIFTKANADNRTQKYFEIPIFIFK